MWDMGEARRADLEKAKFWNRRDRFFFGAEGEPYFRSIDSASPQGLLVLSKRLVPSMLDAFNDKIAHPGTASAASQCEQRCKRLSPALRHLCYDETKSKPPS